MKDKQNETSVHPQGRHYHADKSVKHSSVGAKSAPHNPTVKSGGHKPGHKGR